MVDVAPSSWLLTGISLATTAALALVLVGETRAHPALLWLCKPLASTGFVVLAYVAGALEHGPYGQAIFVALLFSWLGDVLLIPKGAKGPFLAGLFSFLLGHVGYAIAFWLRGIEGQAALMAAIPISGIAVVVFRWLRGRLPPTLRVAVGAYILVISTMLSLAVATASARPHPLLLAAAVLFYLSDLAVARHRFVTAEFRNKAIGLPLYYAAQMLFAVTVMI